MLLFFSPKELLGLSNGERISLLKETYQVDFNTMPTIFKRGVACKKVLNKDGDYKWVIDEDTPFYNNHEASGYIYETLLRIKNMYRYME